MKFADFWKALQNLEKSISIDSPTKISIKRAYWGAPQNELNELPCAINVMSEPDRSVGFGGGRNQKLQIHIHVAVAKASVENEHSSMTTTALWFAAKDAFDRDRTIGGTVSLSLLRGGGSNVAPQPVAPVILQHGGQAYIGFSAVLDVQDASKIEF